MSKAIIEHLNKQRDLLRMPHNRYVCPIPLAIQTECTEAAFKERLRIQREYIEQNHPGLAEELAKNPNLFEEFMCAPPERTQAILDESGCSRLDVIAAALHAAQTLLLDLLSCPDIPRWVLADAAMMYQNQVGNYCFEQDVAHLGKVNVRDRTSTRKANDELASGVLQCLRAEGMSWPRALEKLKDAAENLEAIDGTEIDFSDSSHRGERFTFRRRIEGGPDKIEEFSTSTLRRKKWPKAR